jgi:lysophospholipase L1-like esterase
MALDLPQRGTDDGDWDVKLNAILTSLDARTKASIGAALPSGWDFQWQAAKAAAAAGTGTAEVVLIGDSTTAGQSAPPVTDTLVFGWAGRLDTLLAGSSGANLGGFAEGYTIAGLQPGTGTQTTPSSPYNTPGAFAVYDGGVGQAWVASTTGVPWLTITVPVHPVTSAAPTSIDLLTLDYNTNQWSYAVDGGAAVTVTCAGPGTIGNSILRRTTISLAGTTPHSIVLTNVSANGLIFMGHVAYYSNHGVGIFRNGIPGFRAVDFATGGGSTAGSSGGISATPDHIKPWSGINDAYNNSGASFPWTADLAIIMLGGNDVTLGSGTDAFKKTITRFIHAFRRGNSPLSSTPGASILIVAEGYPSEYGDNFSAVGAEAYEAQRIKTILRDLANSYSCGFIDLDALFGETPVARGLMAAGLVHPTQNGSGAGGGDGHLTIANAIYSIL